MAMAFQDWSKMKVAHPDWQKVEYFHCSMGHVVKLASGDWAAHVWVGSKMGKINGEFGSAPVAMNAVEKVWKREEEKRNGTCKSGIR